MAGSSGLAGRQGAEVLGRFWACSGLGRKLSRLHLQRLRGGEVRAPEVLGSCGLLLAWVISLVRLRVHFRSVLEMLTLVPEYAHNLHLRYHSRFICIKEIVIKEICQLNFNGTCASSCHGTTCSLRCAHGDDRGMLRIKICFRQFFLPWSNVTAVFVFKLSTSFCINYHTICIYVIMYILALIFITSVYSNFSCHL